MKDCLPEHFPLCRSLDQDFEIKLRMGPIIPAYLTYVLFIIIFLLVWFFLVGWVGFRNTAMRDNSKAMLANFDAVEQSCYKTFEPERITENKKLWPLQDLY